MPYLKKDTSQLLFVPLGGCGEIGMNLNLYGFDGKWLMVDCGMTFAGDEAPGVDLVFPDSSFIEDEADKLVGLVVTHGHEDHIGAIAYLWPYLKCPVYATAFTAALIRRKLAEEGIEGDVALHVTAPRTPVTVGPYTVTYQPLAHSIAEGHGLVIETALGRIFHTGDWKLDDRPLIGPISPAPELRAIGETGILALVGDSTNIFNASESGSEAAVRESLLELVLEMHGRVVITTFASNVARLDTAGYLARKTGRQICLLGRSMHRIYAAARETGYLEDFPPLVDEVDVGFLPRDKVLILCTGCQGEPRAALARIARGDHREIGLTEGDHVIFSSKIIPGNERTLGVLFNDLTERGMDVITEKDAFVHVSGHPGRSELKQMMDWVRPTSVIPVHGEVRHLTKHAAFARTEGIEHTLVPKNGDVIAITPDTVEKIDEVPVGRLVLDGTEIVELDSPSVTERRRIAYNGVVALSLVLDRVGGLAGTPACSALGLPGSDTGQLLSALIGEVEAALDRMSRRDRDSDESIEQTARIAVRRYCRTHLAKNPQVMVHIFRPPS